MLKGKLFCSWNRDLWVKVDKIHLENQYQNFGATFSVILSTVCMEVLINTLMKIYLQPICCYINSRAWLAHRDLD